MEPETKQRVVAIASEITDFLRSKGIDAGDASIAMLVVVSGIIGKMASDEGDLLDGIKSANDTIRHYAVKSWEFSKRRKL